MKRVFLAFLICIVSSVVLAASAADRKFIREGMSEGDVLVKIGKPDSESIDTGGAAKITVKRWIYLPAPGDAEMMTTIVIRQGAVVQVERKMSR